jgi:hypothetical protein
MTKTTPDAATILRFGSTTDAAGTHGVIDRDTGAFYPFADRESTLAALGNFWDCPEDHGYVALAEHERIERALVTDAQVEAAARAVYLIYVDDGGIEALDSTTYPWETRSAQVKDRFIRQARAALEAARDAS